MHKNDYPLSEKNIARFWSNIDKKDGQECWLWTSTKDKDGYGKFKIRVKDKRFSYMAHRICYYLTNNFIVHNLIVRHTCDNPSCCNPSHLILGTYKDNSDDRRKRNRTFKKHSDEIVIKIHQLRSQGLTHQEIANKLNLQKDYVSTVVRKKIRKDLASFTKYDDKEISRFTHGKRKLNNYDVIQICNLLNEKKLQYKEIAALFQISVGTVNNIKRGKSWTDISEQYLHGRRV